MQLKKYIAFNFIKVKVFAALLKVTEHHLHAILRGTRWPSKNLMKRIEIQSGGKVTTKDMLKGKPKRRPSKRRGSITQIKMNFKSIKDADEEKN